MPNQIALYLQAGNTFDSVLCTCDIGIECVQWEADKLMLEVLAWLMERYPYIDLLSKQKRCQIQMNFACLN